MQVASLAVIEGVGAARSGGVVSRRVVGKRGKSEAVGVEKRGRKTPWLVVPAGSWVSILDVLVVGKRPGKEETLAGAMAK